jgi:hypothetical protein
MPPLGATRQTPWLVFETQLNRLIAIAILAANLQHMTRTCLNHGNGHCPSVLEVNLRHPDFAAEN